MRTVCVQIHRWSGLCIALFLVVTGLTGTVIAYYDELEEALNPRLFRVDTPGKPLDPLELRRLAMALEPHAEVGLVKLHHAPGKAAVVRLDPKVDPGTGRPYELAFDEVFLDPVSGAMLGTRRFDALRFDREHVMPLIFMLHATFLMGQWGAWLLGAVALVWTVNCFVGFYLTLPERRGRYFNAWKRSWMIRPVRSVVRFSFDLHRAAGLWLWGMLFVLALSSVQFNLGEELFRPALGTVLPISSPRDSMPQRVVNGPTLDWEHALERGRELMARRAAASGFEIRNEAYIELDQMRALYSYSVNSSLDVRSFGGQTELFFSATDGGEVGFVHPHSAGGNTVEAWLAALHTGTVWGWPFQLFVSVMGLAIAAISITGVLVWLKRG